VVAFAVAIVVSVAAAPVADEAPTKVRLNKINLLLRSSVSSSPSSTSPYSRLPRSVLGLPLLLFHLAFFAPPPDLCFSDHPPRSASAFFSTMQPSHLLNRTALPAALSSELRLHRDPDLELHPLPPATATTLFFGRLTHASTPAPSPHPQPMLGAAFHLGVCISGASTTPHRRICRRQRLRCSCHAYPVFGSRCNLVFLGELFFVKWMLNI
jgi:hypothetical protein